MNNISSQLGITHTGNPKKGTVFPSKEVTNNHKMYEKGIIYL